ncbi:MAG TPA: hypothetical protein VLH19_04445 [Patescibacteria group bacterium]|nr:hypothetical protein [Patescibacteria group bacterium]
MTKSDKQFFEHNFSVLNQRYEGLHEEVSALNQKYEKLLTVTSNSAGDIAKIEENTAVLSHHNGEHFDKNEEQDKRLDRLEKKVGLPRLAL